MYEVIVNQLKQIERSHHVKVLFAVESGSRAWGIASKESDYDVRFIYIHPVDWYLTIDPQGIGKKRDVIELPIHDHLDISGWEVTKALRLFRKCNPSILEWMRSSPIYLQPYSFISKLRLLEDEVFNPKSMLSHYIQIAKQNYASLQGENVKVKSYLYAFRSLFACKWIEQFNEIPPIHFQHLLSQMKIDGKLRNEIEQLVKSKVFDKRETIRPIPIFNDYIEHELYSLQDYIKNLYGEKNDPTVQLDKLFLETLREVWNEKFDAF